MAVFEQHLSGEQNLQEFAAICPMPTQIDGKPGRPTTISDNEIYARREEFLIAFEGLWGEIGWQLKRCKNETGVRSALAPLKKIAFAERLSRVFFASPFPRASFELLRKTRTDLNDVLQRYRETELLVEGINNRLARAEHALSECSVKGRHLIRRERDEIAQEAVTGKQKLQTLNESQMNLRRRLSRLEGAFARQELLRFCKSGRYEITPLTLANAVAGLPDIGWRRSMQRCKDQKSNSGERLEYQIFKAIRYLTTKAKKKSADVLIREFHEILPRLPSRYRPARDELGKQWLFLKRALRRAHKVRVHPGALPFEISKHYFQQIRTRSQEDRILAELAELKFSKR